MRPAALIVVNYRTAALAIEAIRRARTATRASLQVVVVDNSVDAAEADALRPHADLLIAPTENLGYGAAVNRARRECEAEVLIVANADVVFGEGAIDRLLDVRAAVAGPALYWDDAFEWTLPPSDVHTFWQEVDRVLATRSSVWARRRDRNRIRARLEFQALKQPVRVRALSGAILAIRATAFDAAGGFDERFRLYFEENDLLRRIAGDILYVPAARCRHIYNQSAAGSAESSALYAASERTYLTKWNGALAADLIKSIERSPHMVDAVPIARNEIEVPTHCWVEASSLPTFDAAAGRFAQSSTVKIPREVWDAYRGATLYVRAVDPKSCEVLATYARSRMAT